MNWQFLIVTFFTKIKNDDLIVLIFKNNLEIYNLESAFIL